MTPSEQTLARPEFESVHLGIDDTDARRTIEETIKGLSASESEEGVRYRTRDGMLVAIVTPLSDGSGDARSALAYRTDPASVSATRKAGKLLEALESHAVDR
jgi:hypothetical protein